MNDRKKNDKFLLDLAGWIQANFELLKYKASNFQILNLQCRISTVILDYLFNVDYTWHHINSHKVISTRYQWYSMYHIPILEIFWSLESKIKRVR